VWLVEVVAWIGGDKTEQERWIVVAFIVHCIISEGDCEMRCERKQRSSKTRAQRHSNKHQRCTKKK
jgi:hypothetical protein